METEQTVCGQRGASRSQSSPSRHEPREREPSGLAACLSPTATYLLAVFALGVAAILAATGPFGCLPAAWLANRTIRFWVRYLSGDSFDEEESLSQLVQTLRGASKNDGQQ